MAYEQKRKIVRLSEEERGQLSSDREDVSQRLRRIGDILAKTLDLPRQIPSRAIVSMKQKDGFDVVILWVEVTYPDGTTVCYQDPPGICCQGACPCE